MVNVVSPVYAEDVSITEIPEKIGESLGVPVSDRAFVGGILMTMILLMALVMPCLLLRNKAPAMIMTILVLCFSTGVQWLNTWVMLVLVLTIAVTWAMKIKRVFT